MLHNFKSLQQTKETEQIQQIQQIQQIEQSKQSKQSKQTYKWLPRDYYALIIITGVMLVWIFALQNSPRFESLWIVIQPVFLLVVFSYFKERNRQK